MLRMSDALTALMAGDVGLRRALSNCYVNFYTGSQPTDANQAPIGQKIIAFRKGTLGTEVVTMPVRPEWKLTLSGTTSGSLDTVKVAGFDVLGGAVTYATSFTNTAALAAAQINSNIANIDFTARSSGADLYIKGPYGVGTGMNALALTATATTLTATVAGDGTPTGSGGTAGVAAANTSNFLPPVDGASLSPVLYAMQLQKEASAWSGKAGFDHSNSAIAGFTSGTLTAGWCRIIASAGDDNTLSTGVDGFLRLDMSVGTSATDVIMSPSAGFAFGAVTTVSIFNLNLPKIAG